MNDSDIWTFSTFDELDLLLWEAQKREGMTDMSKNTYVLVDATDRTMRCTSEAQERIRRAAAEARDAAELASEGRYIAAGRAWMACGAISAGMWGALLYAVWGV